MNGCNTTAAYSKALEAKYAREEGGYFAPARRMGFGMGLESQDVGSASRLPGTAARNQGQQCGSDKSSAAVNKYVIENCPA